MSSNLTSVEAYQYSELAPNIELSGVVEPEPALARAELATPIEGGHVVRLARTGGDGFAPELTREELHARYVAADESSTRTADLPGTWRSLLAGELTIADSFHERGRCFLVLAPRRNGRKSFSARKLSVLEHVLIGGRHKTTTHELKISASTVSMLARQALSFLGLECTPSKVPLMLCVLAHAGRPGAVRRDARLSVVRAGDVEHSVLSIARPDVALHAQLSRGEFAVLTSLVEGKSHKQIAEERDASSHTVANQLTSAFRRLGLSGRLELLQVLAARVKESPALEREPASSPRVVAALGAVPELSGLELAR